MLKDDIVRLEEEIQEMSELIRNLNKDLHRKKQKLRKLKGNLKFVLEQNSKEIRPFFLSKSQAQCNKIG